jgi:Flp pilus assembly pilin Flp
MRIASRKGQSILEYTLLLAVVIMAIIAVLAAMQPKLESSYNRVTDSVTNVTGNMTTGVLGAGN